MTGGAALHLFEGIGIEIEYMLVDRTSLDVLPVADEVLKRAAGRYTNDYDAGGMGWSNEFVLHLLEVKNNRPAPSLTGLADNYAEQVARINDILGGMEGRLMPGAMHPWMDPAKETRLWRRGNRRIYETYDRIFGCRSHGWANVQSMHLNVPFSGDAEFHRLHAAVRFLLPLIPAIAASSPVEEGEVTGLLDTRLRHYRRNQRKVPSIMGRIIPEAVSSRKEYRETVLAKMFRDIAPFDPGATLQHEWLNSRGAVPRFGRNAIEIRVIDSQECPTADMAVAGLIVAVLKALAGERWISLAELASWRISPLLRILDDTEISGERAIIADARYLGALGFPAARATAGEVWHYLAGTVLTPGDLPEKRLRDAADRILGSGTLATRILGALGKRPSAARLREVYERLCDCLAANAPFTG